MSPPLLDVTDLTVTYGPTVAVDRVSFSLDAGRILCLLGANGAGKTTTLRALSGLKRPDAGGIRMGGVDITRLHAHNIARLGLRHVQEGRQVFADLTVAENLTLGAWLDTGEDTRGSPGKAAREAILDRFPRLAERLTQRAGLLSGGEQQMLAIGRALMARPRLLLLDEPSMGLAPRLVAEIFDVIAGLKRDGTAILLVEQNAAASLAIADEAIVLERGRPKLRGPAASLAIEASVAEAYLGA